MMWWPNSRGMGYTSAIAPTPYICCTGYRLVVVDKAVRVVQGSIEKDTTE